METNQREELLTKLQKIVDTKCPGIGSFESSVPDLRYARRSNEKNEIVHCFYDSCIALVLQCSKEVTVGVRVARIKLVIRDAMNDYIWKKTKRKPMVIPIIMDVDV